ncbi:YgaP-like transmembrane domain [Nocardioides sp. R-C-SC26]|uniref:YgaP-like transmembrane domain n=1 Tax=Nocardioides sp. R-C-SC26 TaxID=2870414 RepID=UPI001E317F20|nr:YgaP-like transmembrane domain [Nocardioides sp. R-C-SC26]
MNLDRAVLTLAGSLVLLGSLLTAVVSLWWLLLPVFVGLNLLQASLTGFCPAATILRRLGVPAGCAFR